MTNLKARGSLFYYSHYSPIYGIINKQREVFSMHFKLRDEYIKLEQLLKACDVVSSGGQVKEYLANVDCFVNGEIETRRGRKIRVGDIVETEGIRIEVE